MFSYKNYKGRLSLHVESTQSCSAPSTAHQEGGHVLSLAGLANSIRPYSGIVEEDVCLSGREWQKVMQVSFQRYSRANAR